jgi:hypothetical protein
MTVARAGRRAGWILGLAAALALGAATPARAALPLTLTWDAPAACPTVDDVRAELARLVRFPAGQTPPPLVAEGHIEARDGRWHLRLRTVRDGARGERELEADSCASLAHAATLVMALAFGVAEPEPAAPPPPAPPRPAPRPRAPEAAPPEPPPVVEAPPPPPVVEAPPPKETIVVVAPARPSRPPAVWSLAADARVSNGPLPGVDWGADVGLDARFGRVLASLRLDAWLPTDDAVTGTPARMQFSGAGLTLALCGLAVDGGRLSLAGCALGGGAAITGASTGGLTAQSVTAPWYAAGLGVRARMRLVRRLSLEARVEAEASLTRPRYQLTHRGDVYAVPQLVPTAALGLSFDL